MQQLFVLCCFRRDLLSWVLASSLTEGIITLLPRLISFLFVFRFFKIDYDFLKYGFTCVYPIWSSPSLWVNRFSFILCHLRKLFLALAFPGALSFISETNDVNFRPFAKAPQDFMALFIILQSLSSLLSELYNCYSELLLSDFTLTVYSLLVCFTSFISLQRFIDLFNIFHVFQEYSLLLP